MNIQIRPAVPTDAPPIAAIYNQGIAERSSTFETTLSSAEEMLKRIEVAAELPVLVAVDGSDSVLGWAALCM
jgi:L-amino acid N-acyltransferase YncA